MNKKFTLLAAGVAALFFSACGDNVVESYTPETPVIPDPASPTAVAATAKLTVIVQNGSDKSLEPGATVTLLSTGESATTTAAGAVFFDSVAVGNHGVRVTKTGFASAVGEGTIGVQTVENILQATNGVASVELYPLTAKLEGYLRYEDAANKTKPAAGAEVRLVLTSYGSSTLEKSQFTDTVGTDGKYQFDKLPAIGENGSYAIYALEWTDLVTGITYPTQRIYSQTCSDKALLESSTAFVEHRTYSKNTSLFEVLSFTDKITETSPVVIEFSDSIDVAKFSTNQITTEPVLGFTATVGTVTAAGAAVLPTDKTKLTLTPVGGKWAIDPVANPSGSFAVIINGLKSISGNYNSEYKQVSLLAENSAFELVSITDRISDASPVVLTFSNAIDDTKFSTSLVTINPALNFDVEYSTDKTQLILKPRGGKWVIDPNLYSGQTYFTLSVGPLTSAKGKTANVNNRRVNLLAENSQFDLLNFTNAINISDPIVFAFSDAVDITKVTSSTITTSAGNFDITSAADGKELILTPKGGKWSTTNTSITVNSFTLFSVKGVEKYFNSKSVSVTHTFKLLSDEYASTHHLNSNTDTIGFKFSGIIDKMKFYRGSQQDNSTVWAGTSNWTAVRADIIARNDSVLVVPPTEGWTSDFTVQFNSNSTYALTSNQGEQVSTINNILFRLPIVNLNDTTVAGLTSPTSDSIDYNTSSVYLRWNKLDGATNYRIYGKSTNSSAWTSLGTVSQPTTIPSPDTVSTTVNVSSPYFANGNEWTFVVQAYNGSTQTLLNGASTVTLSERRGPRATDVNPYYDWSARFQAPGDSVVPFYYTAEQYNSGTDGGFTAYLQNYMSSSYNIRTIVYTFSEPVDTIGVGAGSGFIHDAATAPEDAARLVITPTWLNVTSNNPQLRLQLIIAAGDAITTPINSIYRISGFRDKLGNEFKIEYAASPTVPVGEHTANFWRNTLDFRFKATP